jgi:hypothetical protein
MTRLAAQTNQAFALILMGWVCDSISLDAQAIKASAKFTAPRACFSTIKLDFLRV